MTYNIVYSHKAAQQLYDLKSFLRKKWNDQVVISLLDELEESLPYLKKKPSMYPVYFRSRSIRKCIIKKRTIVLYQVSPRQKLIRIVYVGDTRKDPQKISID